MGFTKMELFEPAVKKINVGGEYVCLPSCGNQVAMHGSSSVYLRKGTPSC